eukprot:6490203-Amphidinium_carterae.1
MHMPMADVMGAPKPRTILDAGLALDEVVGHVVDDPLPLPPRLLRIRHLYWQTPSKSVLRSTRMPMVDANGAKL